MYAYSSKFPRQTLFQLFMQTRVYREELMKYACTKQSSPGSTRVPGRAAFVQVDKYNVAGIILYYLYIIAVRYTYPH
jgi:hypothetical protein